MLLLHVITAILTFFSGIFALFRPSLPIRTIFRLFTSLSLGSGLFLTLAPGHFTRSTCLRLGLYLLLILGTELTLHKKIDLSINTMV